MRFDFLNDLSVPNFPELPDRILITANDEADPTYQKMLRISQGLGCSLPEVEFAFGGYHPEPTPNPFQVCDKCRKTGDCPDWSLNFQRRKARVIFDFRMRECAQDSIDRTEAQREALSRATKAANEFDRAYRSLISESHGDRVESRSFLQMQNIKTGADVHEHPTVAEISRLSERLGNSLLTSALGSTKKPDQRGGRNLKVQFVANRCAVLFLSLDRPVRRASNSGKPSNKFCKALELVFNVFDLDADVDGQARRVVKLLKGSE